MNYHLAFRNLKKAVADMEASAETKKFLVDGTKGNDCHTYEIEGDHFQVNDIGLTIYNAQGHSVAAFANGNWKNCRPA